MSSMIVLGSLFLSFIIVIVGIIYNFIYIYIYKYTKNEKIPFAKECMKVNDFIKTHYKKISIFLFFLALFTSLYKFGSVPYGLHVDEAGMAYDAFLLANYGMDRYSNQFPVYLINFGGGQSALYAYLVALLIKVFGYSIYVVRFPALLFRMALVVCGYLLARKNSGKLFGLTMQFLLAITPYFIMQSRWGLDCNLLVGALTISVYFLITALEKEHTKYFVISGIFFGLSLYTYALSYVIVPLFLFLSLIYLLYLKKIKIKNILVFGTPIFLLALPLMLMILVNNGMIQEIRGLITIPALPGYRGAELSLNYIYENLYIFKSILTFDNQEIFRTMLEYNALPSYGTLYYMAIPFVGIGFVICILNLIRSIKNKVFNSDSILVFWSLAVILCQLMIITPNINKANAIFFPLVYFVAKGVFYSAKKIKVFFPLTMVMFMLNFGLFSNYYFNDYNQDMMHQHLFATHYLEAVEYSNTLNTKMVYIEYNLSAEQHIYTLLFNRVPLEQFRREQITFDINNQSRTHIFGLPEVVDMEAVYIMYHPLGSADELRNLGFEEIHFGDIGVFYR